MPSSSDLHRIAIGLLGLWVLLSLLTVTDLLLGGGFLWDVDDDNAPSPEDFRMNMKRIQKRAEARKRFQQQQMKCERDLRNSTLSLISTNSTVNTTTDCDLDKLRSRNPYDAQNTAKGNRRPRFRKNKRREHGGNRTRIRGNTTLALPKPVIVMGFPKAGTSSIFSFFKNQPGSDFKAQHWYCCGDQPSPQRGGPGLMSQCMVHNLANNRSIFHECGDFDIYAEINGPRPAISRKMLRRQVNATKPGVLLDDGSIDHESYEEHRVVGPKIHRIFFPQYFNIQEIHDYYPNATFILNLRPFDSWIKSVQNWGDDDLDWQFINEFYHRGALREPPQDRQNQTQKADILRIIYDEHHERVRQFVKAHPTHTLVEVPILNESAGEILGEAFGLNPSAWGQMNANKKGVARNILHEFVWAETQALEWLDSPVTSFCVLLGGLAGVIYLVMNILECIQLQRRRLKTWRR